MKSTTATTFLGLAALAAAAPHAPKLSNTATGQVATGDLGLAFVTSSVVPTSAVSVVATTTTSAGSSLAAAAATTTTTTSGNSTSTSGFGANAAVSSSSSSSYSSSTSSASVATATSLYNSSTYNSENGTSVSSSSSSADLTVLNFAFTLETLETQFYAQALQTFDVSDMVSVGFSEEQATAILEQIQVIASDENTHATTIASVINSLGSTPFQGCSFNFESLLSDPLTFVSSARTIELIGVSAYLGAANILTDPTILTAAASIATIESRHSSLLNVFNGGSAIPQPFDIPLSPQEILAMVGGVLQGCQASDFGLTSNSPLAVIDLQTQSTRFQIGSQLSFQSSQSFSSSGSYCQMLVGGAATALVFPAGQCVVPSGVDGPVAVYITSSSTPLAADVLVRDESIVVAGPTYIFVDSISSSFSSSYQISKYHGGLASANFGYLYMQTLSGNEQSVAIVVQTEEVITEQTAIVIANQGSSSSSSSGHSSRKGHSQSLSGRSMGRQRRQRRQALGDVKAVGWSRVRV